MMKAITCCVVFFVVASGNASVADENVPDDSSSFVPNTFVQYQRTYLNKQEFQKIKSKGDEYVNSLLDGLESQIPEYEDWLARGSIPANPNMEGARMLHRLADHRVSFSRDQIGRIVEGLNHPHGTVVYDIRATLTQTFGIWFVDGADWVHKPRQVRKRHIQAWRKFWGQNQARYGKGLPLIINDLSMGAVFVEKKGAKYLTIQITNHWEHEWHLITEISGEKDRKKDLRREPREWKQVYSLIVDGKTVNPVMPAAYFLTARVLSPAERAALPDRPVHIGEVTVAPSQMYTYFMNIEESFPGINLVGKEIVVRYAYGLYGTEKHVRAWRGELRSLPIQVK